MWRCNYSLSIIGKPWKLDDYVLRNVHRRCNRTSQPKYKIRGDIHRSLYRNSFHIHHKRFTPGQQ